MYSPAFSRLFVYLSVFLLLSSSVSAKPTPFTRDSASSPLAKRAQKPQKHDDINVAHSTPNTSANSAPSKNRAGTSARPNDAADSVAHSKNTVANEGTLKNVVVDAAHPKIASAKANTKKVAVVDATQPKKAPVIDAAQPKKVAVVDTTQSKKAPVVDAAQPKKNVVVNAPDPKDASAKANTLTDTAFNEARLRDAAANLATPRVIGTPANTPKDSGAKVASANVAPPNGVNANTNANPARLQNTVTNRNTPNVAANVAAQNTAGGNNSARPNTGVDAPPLNVNVPNSANVVKSAGSSTAPVNLAVAAVAGPNPGLNTNTIGSRPGVTVATGGATSPKGAASVSTTGDLTNIGSTAAGAPLINLSSNLPSGTSSILNAFSASTNGPPVDTRLMPGANVGSGSTLATVQFNPTTDTGNNVTPALSLLTSGANIPVAVGGGPSPGKNNNALLGPGSLALSADAATAAQKAGTNGASLLGPNSLANAITGSTSLVNNAFGNTATPGNTDTLSINLMSSSG